MTQETHGGEGEFSVPPDDASEFGLSSRSGKFGRDLAMDIVSDPRLSMLSPRSLGVFFLIKAHEEALFPLSATPRESAAKLHLTVKAFTDVIGELIRQPNSMLKIPLIEVVDGTLRALPFGKPVARAVQEARSKAADKRWEKAAEAALAEAAAAAEKPVKQAKPRKPKAVEAPIEVPDKAQTQVSLFGADEVPPAQGGSGDAAPKLEPTPYEEIYALFLKHCPSLPVIKAPNHWPETRRKHLDARWKIMPNRQAWVLFYQRIEKSDFLTGRRTDFKASFDWVNNPANFHKIGEGNFDNIRKPGKQPLFNNGAKQFEVGSYGNHEIDMEASWMNAPLPEAAGGQA